MKNSMRKIIISHLSILVLVGIVGMAKTLSAKPPPIKPKPVILVRRGLANIDIVLPSSATSFEKDAAGNLKEYLERVTSATIVIKREDEVVEKIPIYVGRCLASEHLIEAVEALKYDGFVIQIKGTAIHLLGKNDLATRFAVYGFLEDYIGVRWFLPEVWGDDFPENLGTHIPEQDTVILRQTFDVQDPSFPLRFIGRQEESRVEQWTICNKVNFIDHDVHGFQINQRCHSFFSFIHPWDYYNFPDYFRMLDGEFLDSLTLAKMKKEDANAIKLNVGNPEVKATMVAEVVNYIDNNPEIDIINLFPNDGLQFCESPESKLMDGLNYENYTVEMVNDEGKRLGEEFGRVLSKRYTMFYHDVIEGILALRPRTPLMAGAYSAYQHAPLEVRNNPSFVSKYKMDDGVMLLICHQHEHNHPIEDRSTEPNIYFDDSIGDWKKLYSLLGVYEYYRPGRMHELPFPIIHSIRRDIPYYYANDFRYFYTQYKLEDIGTYALNHYIAAKLLWDVDADVKRLLSDFFAKFYGSAARHMAAYFERLEVAAIESNLELFPTYYESYLKLFTDDVLEDCSRHLEKAKSVAEENKLFLTRVELSEVSLNYTEKVIGYLKEIERIIDLDNKLLRRRFSDEDLYDAEKMAQEIRKWIEAKQPYKTIFPSHQVVGDKDGKDGMLDVRKVVRADMYGNTLTKGKWLDRKELIAESGYGDVERFDVWIYGYDIQYSRTHEEPEHTINIFDKSGNRVELGQIAANEEEDGKGEDRGFLLSDPTFLFDYIIGDCDSVTLEILNPKEYMPSSTFFAVAIMPHMADLKRTVTDYYQNQVNYIRENAIGFIEFAADSKYGEPPVTVTIDLFSH
jgi:hypothetical protein